MKDAQRKEILRLADSFGETRWLGGAGRGMTPPNSQPDETVTSPLVRNASQPQELWPGSPAAKQKASKAKKGAPPKQPKVTRCGQCYTCKNKQLKKVIDIPSCPPS